MRVAVVSLLFALALLSPAAWKASGCAPVAVPAKLARAVIETGAVGSLRADEAVVIRPEIAGRIDRIAFDEGQSVKKGAARDARRRRDALVASSRVQAGLDKQRMERAADLHKKGFISQQALDEMQSTYARSAAKLREDEAKLAKSEIRAPFSGVAGPAPGERGRLRRRRHRHRAPREDRPAQARLPRAGDLSRPAQVRPRGEHRGGRVSAGELPGKIYAIEPAVDEQTRTVLARARVANPQLRLRPACSRACSSRSACARTRSGSRGGDRARGQDSYVWRVVDGKAELVPVQTGTRKVGEVEIMKGVAAGDIVVTEGTQRLAPGMQVSIIPSAKPAAAIPARKAASVRCPSSASAARCSHRDEPDDRAGRRDLVLAPVGARVPEDRHAGRLGAHMYKGASPQVMESQITQPLEDSIAGIEGVRGEVVSRAKVSQITVEFVPERDVDSAANDVRDRVARVRALPRGVRRIGGLKIEADAQAIIWLGLSSDKHSSLELSDYADRYIADRLKTLPGVASVIIGGGRRYAMRIWLDREARRLLAHAAGRGERAQAPERRDPGRAHRVRAPRVHRARRSRPAHRRAVQQHDHRGTAATRSRRATSARRGSARSTSAASSAATASPASGSAS